MAPLTQTLNVLFMDLAGWSKLSPTQIALYVQKALPRLSEEVKKFHAAHVNTWGDALVVTFSSSKDAAECALDIRDFFRRASDIDGVPAGLTPRVSLHVGEVIIANNPLLGHDDVFGDTVHLAARLEPVTLQGQVFCTEAFAKSLSSVSGLGAIPHELEEVDLPKGFGRVKVYVVTGANEAAPTQRAKLVEPESNLGSASQQSVGEPEFLEFQRFKASFDEPSVLDQLTYIEILDAWCFVYAKEASWKLHVAWRAWSSIAIPATMRLKGVSVSLRDGPPLGDCDPRDRVVLALGPNEKKTWTVILSAGAAEKIREQWALSKHGVWITVTYHFSVETERAATTDRHGQRAITISLRVQTEE